MGQYSSLKILVFHIIKCPCRTRFKLLTYSYKHQQPRSRPCIILHPCSVQGRGGSGKMTPLLLGLVSTLPFLWVSLSLPEQIFNSHHTDSVLKVLFNVKFTFKKNLTAHLEKFLSIQRSVMYKFTCIYNNRVCFCSNKRIGLNLPKLEQPGKINSGSVTA